jgi:hypothetical protein
VVFLARERHPREGGGDVNLEKIWITIFAEMTAFAITQQEKMVNALLPYLTFVSMALI